MTESAVAAPSTPFKGLAPFEDSALDALLFFGREREIEVIAANLMANRLTVLYGPSGVGKTSLLRAGLAQRLRREPEAVVIVASSWGDDPVAALLDAIEPGPQERSLPDALENLSRRLDSNVYLVLDQFEEYFLYHGDDPPDKDFSTELAGLIATSVRVNLLIAIREDAFARLDRFEAHVPRLFEQHAAPGPSR